MIVYIGVPEEAAAQLKKDDVYRAPNEDELLPAVTSLMALSELGIEGKVFIWASLKEQYAEKRALPWYTSQRSLYLEK